MDPGYFLGEISEAFYKGFVEVAWRPEWGLRETLVIQTFNHVQIWISISRYGKSISRYLDMELEVESVRESMYFL